MAYNTIKYDIKNLLLISELHYSKCFLFKKKLILAHTHTHTEKRERNGQSVDDDTALTATPMMMVFTKKFGEN